MLPQWMKPEQRKALSPAAKAGATAEVRYIPKGVVVIIGSWSALCYSVKCFMSRYSQMMTDLYACKVNKLNGCKFTF